jgi:hypothetical protein
VLEAFLDALGDLDLALAGKQILGAHFAHVHTHRVGGAAEFGVHAGESGFRFLGGVLVRHRGGGLGHEQVFGGGSLVEDLDAHVVDHADDAFDLLGVQHLVREMVVHLGIGQVTPLLAEHDQVFQAGAPRLDIGLAVLLIDRLSEQGRLAGGVFFLARGPARSLGRFLVGGGALPGSLGRHY